MLNSYVEAKYVVQSVYIITASCLLLFSSMYFRLFSYRLIIANFDPGRIDTCEPIAKKSV